MPVSGLHSTKAPVTACHPAYRSCNFHSSLRVTCLPGLGAHDTSPLTPPTHTGTCVLEHASPLPRSQAHLASNLRVTCASSPTTPVKCFRGTWSSAPPHPISGSPNSHQCGPALVKGISLLIPACWDMCTLAAGSPEGKRHIFHPVLKYFGVLNSKTGIAA